MNWIVVLIVAYYSVADCVSGPVLEDVDEDADDAVDDDNPYDDYDHFESVL